MSDDFDFDFRHLHEVVARDRDHDRSVSFVHGYKNDGVHRKCYAKLGRARVAAAAGETDADVANEGRPCFTRLGENMEIMVKGGMALTVPRRRYTRCCKVGM